MNEIIIQDLIKVLKRSVGVLKKRTPRFQNLNNLSNNTIHNASIFQDHLSISVAIIMYALYKVFSRGHKKPNSEFSAAVVEKLEKMIVSLEKHDTKTVEADSKELLDMITKADQNTKEYIQEVIEKARITKASKIYSHGISLQRTADMLGITLWQLERYIGHTHIPEQEECLIDPIDRLGYAEKVILGSTQTEKEEHDDSGK